MCKIHKGVRYEILLLLLCETFNYFTFKSKSLIESYIHKSLYIDNSRVKISLLSERQADTSAKIWLKFLNMYTIRERKILYYEDKDHMFLGCLFTEQRCLHLPIDLAFFEIAANKIKYYVMSANISTPKVYVNQLCEMNFREIITRGHP